ncbi:UNVERIFIED_CONTAM: protein argonaute 5 [Sesamum angustifolium]|uniref:Protein argonaute 5 n=1 Tax=Sesamum angustifolium TaxID=2727405 RepID=A0AAW2QPE6_9LAMI
MSRCSSPGNQQQLRSCWTVLLFSRVGRMGELGNGLEYWKDMSARAFFEPILVSEYVFKYFDRDLTRPLSDQDRLKVPGRVEQRICCQYFRQKYNIVLHYPFLPAIQAGSSVKPVSIPMEMVKHNNYNNDILVKEFGMQVRLNNFNRGTGLPAPVLKYHETGRQTVIEPRVGQWNMIDKEFNPRPLVPIRSAHPGQIEKSLSDVHAESSTKFVSMKLTGKQLQLLIIILPDASGSYGGGRIPSGTADTGKCILLTAGISDRAHLIVLPSWRMSTHPNPGEDSSPSIAAGVSAQATGEEMIQDLYTEKRSQRFFCRELLIAFYKSTGQKPHRIIFYRTISQVLLHEMEAIRKACVSIEEQYLPKVTFVVVQKRHHTRLFPADHGDKRTTDRSGNILPGTVVRYPEYVIPMSLIFTFVAMQGFRELAVQPITMFYTTRIGHQDGPPNLTNTCLYKHFYVEFVIGLDFSHYIKSTLLFIFQYARCTRSVSIVPPAYYAHLAAFRARYYIEGSDLSDSESTAAGSGGVQGIRTERSPFAWIKR